MSELTNIARDAIDQTEIIMLSYMITMLKKYPVELVIAELEEDLANKKSKQKQK
jgi:hypothetical protein